MSRCDAFGKQTSKSTQGVVERKTTIPILSNYLFEASNDKLSLTRAGKTP
jgi:DNA polymerase III sliding clamp (beta) subunit (PCNA family)